MAKQQNPKAWLYLLPALALLFVVGLVPLVTVFNYSFHELFLLDQKFWVGTEWYGALMGSQRFWAGVGRSLLFALIILAVEIPLGIATALMMPKKGLWVPVCLVVFALPLLVPWNMIPMIWIGLLDTQTGIYGQALAALGIDFDRKFNAVHTWTSLVAMDAWHWTSLVVILCYSSLTTIPGAYYQAAAIDSASRWQVFRHIELPKMAGVLLMAILLRFMDSFMIYTEAFRFNGGGPNDWTMFAAVDLGQEIGSYSYGPSAARSVVLFLFALTVAWIFSTALRARTEAATGAAVTAKA